MRKVALLLAGVAMAQMAAAQVTLTGTSYTQNFDNLSSGLPLGWSVRTDASATALGTDVSSAFASTIGSATEWGSFSGNFRNVASADAFSSFAAGTASLQATTADRSLAVRQVGNTSSTFPGSDPGAAFVLEIANTAGFNNFTLSFKLQSLDSTSPRTTTWAVDYGFGATPTSFTAAAATGTLTTGGNTYSNNTINVNFGTILDNQTGPIWIRIVTLSGTTGGGNRTTSGIDDFNLTWNAGPPSYKPVITALSPSDNASNVTAGSDLQVTFNRHIAIGTGSIRIQNVTDQTTVTKTLPSADVTVSGYVATIANTGIVASKDYYVTFDSTAFDTATFKSYGIYDTTAWNFNTFPVTYNPTATSFIPADNASGVAPGSILSVAFNHTINKNSTGNVTVMNLTDGTSQTIGSSDITVINKIAYITTANLLFGKNYAVHIDSQLFDTAGYRYAGIYDDATWNFSMNQAVASVPTLNESFDNTCIPNGWQKYSAAGVQEWYCTGTTNKYMVINGYSNSTNNVNEDYLIAPKHSASSTPGGNFKLIFRVNNSFAGDNVKAMVSNNYTGTGNAATATWVDLNVPFTSSDSNKWVTKTVNIPVSVASSPFYVAFKYTSSTSDGKRIYIDSVVTIASTGVINVSRSTLPLTVIGQASNSHADISFTAEHGGKMHLSILDLTGREVYAEEFIAQSGNQRHTINGFSLNGGLYLIKLSDDQEFGVTKVMIP